MANFEIGENPELELSLKKLETTDQAHADLFNSLFKTLINNDAFLNNLAAKMVEKSQIVRNLLETEPGKVLDATMGKELGDQITQLDRDVSVLNTNLGKYYSLRDAIDIPEGSDLNNYTDFGNYISIDANVSKTLHNCPVAGGGFILHVERITGRVDGSFCMQKIVYNSTTPTLYCRTKSGSTIGWMSWVKILTGNDV